MGGRVLPCLFELLALRESLSVSCRVDTALQARPSLPTGPGGPPNPACVSSFPYGSSCKDSASKRRPNRESVAGTELTPNGDHRFTDAEAVKSGFGL